MKKKSKGFTLIETIVALFLSIIVLNIGINTMVVYYKSYCEIHSNNIINDDIDDALISIDNILKSYMIKDINVIEDRRGERGEISVIYAVDHLDNSKTKRKIIKFKEESGKIVLQTEISKNNNIISKGENSILKNVEDFIISKKGNIFYFRIIHKSGVERIQCI